MPKTTIEQESPQVEGTPVEDAIVQEPEVQPAEAPAERSSKADGVRGINAARGWVSRTFPGHEHAFYGGVAGLVAALLVFAIGIGRTLFITLLVFVGVAMGQAADGDAKIVRTIRGFIESRNNQ